MHKKDRLTDLTITGKCENVNANIAVSWKAKINNKNYYATNLMVKRIDRKKNKVYCKNWCGYPYQFYGVDNMYIIYICK